MKSTKLSFFSAWILTSCITMTAWGDDLEIYLGTNQIETIYAPNVLFIMDTSGSMSNKDGGSESRLLRVQNGLSSVLRSATNINAGLMRFSDYGGPILYPVTSIDSSIESDLVYSISRSENDAHEIDGTTTIDSNEITITDGTRDVYSGFRFEDVQVPQGATITRAYMRLYSGGLDAATEIITLYGELESDSQAFAENTNDISSRNKTAPVVWALNNNFPVADELVSTPGVGSIIQEIVNQADWCGGNALSLIMASSALESSSAKTAFAAEDGRGLAPQLVINYDTSSSSGCISRNETYQVQSQSNNVEERSDGTDSTGNELTFRTSDNDYTAARFTNVRIPNSATIESAKLVFTAFQNSDSNAASIDISVINEDNTGDYSDHVNYQIHNAPKTSAVTLSIPEIDQGDEYTSPELKDLVQTVVNRPGWSSGNAMAFVMSDFVGSRGAYTYNGSASGAVRLEISYTGNAEPGSAQTVRDYLITLVNELTADGYTPVVDTLYEAANYYAGNDVDYGLARGTSAVSSSVRRSTRVSNELSYVGASPIRPSGCSELNLSDNDCVGEIIPDGARYISPINNFQCQTNNHIVLLSDGRANNNHSVSKIKSLLGIDSCTRSGGEECGIDLVKNISNKAQSVVGTSVTTHTIGFAANADTNNYLNRLALDSGGTFHTADNSDNLIEAFNSILQSVKDVSATFVSPGVAVNQLNRLTHRDELYYAVFKPDERKVWPGNLKRYKIQNNRVLDQNGQAAVDPNTGFFKDDTQSFWSLFADGAEVSEGGAASLLRASRKLYVVSGNGNVVSEANELHEDNTEITEELLNIDNEPSADALREAILKWSRGVDVKDEDGDGDVTDVRFAMGDPIHSQPAVVDYSATLTSIFVATNQGFLHSFDAETGLENFAIIPQELLPNLHDFYENPSTLTHTYGIDGDLVLRSFDNKKFLYVGMRRGGSSYYVFDVTERLAPKLEFSINPSQTGLEKMGQSWSRPTITKVQIGSSVKDVMIVGGGYDESQDDKSIRSEDSVGNAVYMFDANTGDLLWSAANEGSDLVLSEMKYSIPGRVSVIDRNNDGLADHMYVADMGAQLFRFDIYNGKSGEDFIKGARIADFGGDSEADNRRFYYGPDVAEVALGPDLYYAVAIGSGKRASPLDQIINDRFYMLRDESVFQLNEDGTYTLPESAATESDLYDASLGLLTSEDESVIEAQSSEFANKSGWMLRLTTSGEKVLSSPLILDFNVFFTTYIPAASNPSECAPPTGSSRAYLVNLLNANAVDFVPDPVTNEQSSPQTAAQNVAARSSDTPGEGLPPTPTFSVPSGGGPISICLGTICARTQPKLNSSGEAEACADNFECLSENIFGGRERVRKDSWKTETESN